MSDLETRLRDTLTERAGAAAPDATRARRRCAPTAAATSYDLGGRGCRGRGRGSAAGPRPARRRSSDGGGRVADEPTATSGLPPGVIETGYRAESWHDVTFEVPVRLGLRRDSGWCAGGATLAEAGCGRRPAGHGRAAIACTSRERATASPSGHWSPPRSTRRTPAATSGSTTPRSADVRRRTPTAPGWASGTTTTPSSPSRPPTGPITRRLVDSVQPLHRPRPQRLPGDARRGRGARAPLPYDAFSICRYGDRGPALGEPAARSGGRVATSEDAIFSSPRRTADYDCPTEDDLSPIGRCSPAGGYVATAVTDAACPGWNGLFLDGVVRDLTPRPLRHLDLWQLPVRSRSDQAPAIGLAHLVDAEGEEGEGEDHHQHVGVELVAPLDRACGRC